MRAFTKVVTTIWASERFRSVTDDARLLHLYYMTSHHQTACGCFLLPDGYALADMQWDTDRYQTARTRLVEADLVAHDARTQEVRITRWFEDNPPMNPSHRKAVDRAIERINSAQFREQVLAELNALDCEKKAKSPPRNPTTGYSLAQLQPVLKRGAHRK